MFTCLSVDFNIILCFLQQMLGEISLNIIKITIISNSFSCIKSTDLWGKRYPDSVLRLKYLYNFIKYIYCSLINLLYISGYKIKALIVFSILSTSSVGGEQVLYGALALVFNTHIIEVQCTCIIYLIHLVCPSQIRSRNQQGRGQK